MKSVTETTYSLNEDEVRRAVALWLSNQTGRSIHERDVKLTQHGNAGFGANVTIKTGASEKNQVNL